MPTSVNPVAQQRTWDDLAKSLKAFSDAMSNKREQNYYSTAAPYNSPAVYQQQNRHQPMTQEAPQSLRSEYQSYPYQVDFRQLDQVRQRSNQDARFGNQMANQNAENSLRRRIRQEDEQSSNRKEETANSTQLSDASYANRKRTDFYDDRARRIVERNSQVPTLSISTKAGGWMETRSADGRRVSIVPTLDPERVNREHDKNMLRLSTQSQIRANNQQAYNNRLQAQMTASREAAQNKAQERLALINQQTALYQSTLGNPGQSNWRWF